MISTKPPASPSASRPARAQSGKGSGPAKTSRIELRASEDDRNLLDRAAAALGTDRSSFLLAQGRLAAQRVLADREQFVLIPTPSRNGSGSTIARPAACPG